MGCYGKLPLHRDFIRHSADLMVVEPLLQWLEESVARAKRARGQEWGGALAAGQSTCFAWRNQDRPCGAVGALVASRDRAGRRWPFIVFRTWQSPPNAHAPRGLLRLEGFFRAAAKAVTLARQGFDSIDALRAHVDGLDAVEAALATGSGDEDFLRNCTVGELWGAWTGEDARDRQCLILQNAGDAFAGGVPRYALRCSSTGTLREVAFLIELCRRVARGHGSPWPSLLLWSGAGPLDVCRLVFDRLSPRYYAPLFWEGEPHELAFDLAGPGAAKRLTAARARFADFLARPETTLAEVIEAACGG
ncbi:MAG: type VI secretion system-associated protein TagF [Planctomycetota bacterium]